LERQFNNQSEEVVIGNLKALQQLRRKILRI